MILLLTLVKCNHYTKRENGEGEGSVLLDKEEDGKGECIARAPKVERSGKSEGWGRDKGGVGDCLSQREGRKRIQVMYYQ